MSKSEPAPPERTQDPDEKRQQQVLDALRTAEQNLHETWREARMMYHLNEIDKHSYRTIVRGDVELFIMQLETMMRRLESDPTVELSRDYWNGVRLGEMRLPSGSMITFTGLQSILVANDPITDQWIEQTTSLVGGETTERKQEAVQIPLRILKQAMRACNQFLQDADLDYQFGEDGLPSWGYEDVEEVPDGVEVI